MSAPLPLHYSPQKTSLLLHLFLPIRECLCVSPEPLVLLSSGHSHCLYNSISKSPHTILGYFLYYDLSNSLAVSNTVYQHGEITWGEALTSYIVCLPLCLSFVPNYTANDFREEIKISVDASGHELEILGAWHLINSHPFTLDSFVPRKLPHRFIFHSIFSCLPALPLGDVFQDPQ